MCFIKLESIEEIDDSRMIEEEKIELS